MVGLILFGIASVCLISWAWVKGIDNMKEKHPEYKGEDFLNWDDNKVNSEGDF